MAYRAESILEELVTSSLDFFLRVTISVLLLTPATSGSQVWRPWILLPAGGKVPPGVYVCVPEHSGVPLGCTSKCGEQRSGWKGSREVLEGGYERV